MTGRLPFDPGRMKPKPEPVAAAQSDRPLTVAQLAARVDTVIKSGLPGKVRVLGEISGLRERTHYYFTIKDEGAAFSAVIFASTARRLDSRPADGMQIIATGRVEFYGPSGKLSLIVDRLDPVGKGPLEARFQQLAAELRTLGWFDPEHKKPLPVFPRRIAVVTSATGAALQDVIDTARRRCPAVGLLVVDARVQGDSAVSEVSRAVRGLGANRQRLGIDAILITRGGGSIEDLWAFNEREVAQAIWECPLPVIAAIGHETDTTIAELVADERGATPTQAAMRLTPDRVAIGEQVGALARRLDDSTRGRFRFARERLRRFAERPAFQSPAGLVLPHAEKLTRLEEGVLSSLAATMARRKAVLDRLGMRLERARPASQHARQEERVRSLGERLGRAARRRLDPQTLDRLARSLRAETRARLANTEIDLEAVRRELEAISPTRVLQRGYSVTLDATGRALTDAGTARPGDLLRTLVSNGEVESQVKSGKPSLGPAPSPERKAAVRPEGSPAAPTTPAPARSRRGNRDRRQDHRDQMDLFGSGG